MPSPRRPSSPAGLVRIRRRGTLVVLALVLQAVVLLVGWLVTFRQVRDAFAREVEARVLEENAELASRILQILPDQMGGEIQFGSEAWDELQQVIEGLTDLPGEGFACIIEPDGRLLCHPEIRDNRNLRDVDLGNEVLRLGRDEAERTLRLEEAPDDALLSGRVHFLADDTHYVATGRVPGSDLRLLVHQPVKGLIRLGRDTTRMVLVSAICAAAIVLVLTATGLGWLVRRYESVVESMNERLLENLRVAERVQRATLPRAVPRAEGWELTGWCAPADETGGDTYDLIGVRGGEDGRPTIDETAPERLFLLLADATGHGIGPALAVTQLRSMVRMAVRSSADPAAILESINEQLHADLPTGRFITAWLATIEIGGDQVESLSAGQGPLLAWRAATSTLERFMPETQPLGVLPSLDDARPTRIPLAAGDLFLAISDGILEAPDEAGRHFGVRGVEAVLGRLEGASAGTVAAALRDAVETHAAGEAALDDQTVVVVRRAGGAQPAAEA